MNKTIKKLKHNTGRLKVNKFNYDENSQLKTRLAILESQLKVAHRESNKLKIKNKHLDKIIKQYDAFSCF